MRKTKRQVRLNATELEAWLRYAETGDDATRRQWVPPVKPPCASNRAGARRTPGTSQLPPLYYVLAPMLTSPSHRIAYPERRLNEIVALPSLLPSASLPALPSVTSPASRQSSGLVPKFRAGAASTPSLRRPYRQRDNQARPSASTAKLSRSDFERWREEQRALGKQWLARHTGIVPATPPMVDARRSPLSACSSIAPSSLLVLPRQAGATRA